MCLLLQASFVPAIVGVCCFRRSVAGNPSFDLSMLLAVANNTALLVLLWVFLLYSTERLQQQGLKKLQEWKNDYVLPASVIRRVGAPRISESGSRRLRVSVIRGVDNSA